jgi:hypothetical protein
MGSRATTAAAAAAAAAAWSGARWALPVLGACLCWWALAAGCEGKRVGPALQRDASDGSGGAGTPGTGGGAPPGTGGRVAGTGGAGSGSGGSGGVAGTGGAGSCVDEDVRGVCPSAEVCTAGTWVSATSLQCAACGIVTCPATFSPCCSGFGTFGLTAFTFLPKPAIVRTLTAGPAEVVADFMFTEAYEIGAIQLLLASEIPIRAVNVQFTYTGDVYPDFSMERNGGDEGAAYDIDSLTGDANLAFPVRCFPDQSRCATTFNRVDVRLRPYGPGPARLTITRVTIGS